MSKRPPVDLPTMQAIATQFQLGGTVVNSGPYGSGHINDTYAVTTANGTTQQRYIFQRINDEIFKDVDALMSNIVRVTEHVRQKLTARGMPDVGRRTMTVIRTHDEATYYRTPEGHPWRVYEFVEGAQTYDVLSNAKQAYQAAKAFGAFQVLLADFPAPPLVETIARFHHTPSRYAKLLDTIERDPCNRAATCRDEIQFVLDHEAITSIIEDDLASGVLPTRVTHNDTKINNVMLDDQTGDGICVIDLDTVMPGSVLYDFGDEIRTSVGHFQENERDLSLVYADMDFFRELVAGYLSATRDHLNTRERELLVFSGIVGTFRIGLRFLTDYLEGDVYFRTHRDGENLDRARTQFTFTRDLEKQRPAMEAIASSA
ncbi:MAG: aminoglycoside phosphotransferase family protein [Verrucomicrobia bacterium]|nr:aminoglycoside phosphotransferase family protein [Verrucomicrobiota bacterium]